MYVIENFIRNKLIHLIQIDLGLSCNSNVCLNGGTCSYNSTNIWCICPTGFAGARCEWSKKKIDFFYLRNI
jgi:hypothetical protein